MGELVDADSVSLPTASTGSNPTRQSETISCGNRALVYRRRGKRGTRSEEIRGARRAPASKQKYRRWRSRGVVGELHPTRRKNESKILARHLELSERRRVLAWKKRRGKQVMGNGACIKHKATGARSPLDELTFGAFNGHTAAVNGVNGIGHIDTLLRPCAARGFDVIGLQETKRDGTSETVTSGYRVYFSGDNSRVKYRKG